MKDINESQILIEKIAKKIQEKGGKIYYVGGYVRDKKIGIENKDIDVEIYGISFEEISNILSEFGKIDLVGASFGIYKIQGIDIDFCFPRRETLIGKGHKDFEVSVDPYISTKDAAKRRDFTINSIMQDVNTGEFIDNFGGIGDLDKKIIKHIDDKTFVEDPLRVLRACQFAARLGFDIDENTVSLCKTLDISVLPQERIYEEVKKGLLKAKKPSIFIQRLIEIEKLESIFHGIKINSEKLEQLYELLNNSARNKEFSNNPEYFMFSSLIYGLKKIDCNLDIGEMAKYLSKDKAFNESIKNLVNNKLNLDDYIENHADICDYDLKKFVISSIDKYGVFNIDDLLLLDKSSSIGRENGITNKLLEERVSKFDLDKRRTIERKYTGEDLKRFGVPVSKAYKDILNKAFDLQLQDATDEQIQEYLNSVAKEEIIKSVATKIEEQGGHCYFFGGYVRDKIIGKKPNDMDVQVIGITNEKFNDILGRYGEVLSVGKTFSISKLRTGIDIDFLSPEDYSGEILSIKEAQKRIDFTMNTVFENVLTGEMIDNFNGIQDIKDKIIRMTDKDTFVSDKIRSLRACRFASELGFSISQDTIDVCKQFEFNDISNSRVYEEVKKTLLRSKKPSVFFNSAYSMDIVKKLFSPMDKMKGLEQEPKYHPEGDVWEHTMKVLDFAASFRDEAQDKSSFMFGAQCHDFGKISTTVINMDENGNKKITSFGHDLEIKESKSFMEKLGVPKKVMNNAIALQKTHMRPDTLYKQDCRISTVKKLIEDSNNQLNDCLLISNCDRLGSGIEVTQEKLNYIDNRKKWYEEKSKALQEMEEQSKVEVISGKELIDLGFKPGPLFRIIQNEYRQMSYDGISKEDIIGHILEKYGKKFDKKDISTVVENISFNEVGNVLDKMREKEIEGEII